MGLFGSDSTTTRRETNITKRTTRTDTDVETVSGVKATGESAVSQSGGPLAQDSASIQQAGGSIGLTGANFANVANNLSKRLGQGVNALAAGAQEISRQANAASENVAQLSTARSRAQTTRDPNMQDTGGGASAGGRTPEWVMPALIGVGVLAALGVGTSMIAAFRG